MWKTSTGGGGRVKSRHHSSITGRIHGRKIDRRWWWMPQREQWRWGAGNGYRTYFSKIVFLEDDNGVIKDGTRDLCLVNLLMVKVLSKTGESQGRQLGIGGSAITSSIY